MVNDGPSELPQHYGGRTSDGEVVRRPGSPTIPTSPGRAFTGHSRNYSPERKPFGIDIPSQYISDPNVREGLRRRPSGEPGNLPYRRYSHGEADQPRPSLHEVYSRRPLRSRNDGWYRDEDRTYRRREEFAPHPDAFECSRPPRSYRNIEAWDRVPGWASKPISKKSEATMISSVVYCFKMNHVPFESSNVCQTLFFAPVLHSFVVYKMPGITAFLPATFSFPNLSMYQFFPCTARGNIVAISLTRKFLAGIHPAPAMM